MTMKAQWMVGRALAIVSALSVTMAAGAQSGGEIRFGNAKIELRFDQTTGRWLSLRYPAAGVVLMENGGLASVVLTTDGQRTTTTGRKLLWSIQDARTIGARAKLVASREEREGDKRRLILQTEEGNWQIVHSYEMASEGDTVEQRVSLTWDGPQETLLRWVDFRTPISDARGDNLIEAPGYPGVLHQRLASLPFGQWPLMEDIPRGRSRSIHSIIPNSARQPPL